MYRLIFIGFVVMTFVSRGVMAQVLLPSAGSVEIDQDDKIAQLADQYRKMSLNNPEFDGYRVQIFFDAGSSSKNKAANVKTEFETMYPGIKSYLSYKEPYYRIRVGDFRVLTEAVGFQKMIASDYPNSFPVKDKIIQ